MIKIIRVRFRSGRYTIVYPERGLAVSVLVYEDYHHPIELELDTFIPGNDYRRFVEGDEITWDDLPEQAKNGLQAIFSLLMEFYRHRIDYVPVFRLGGELK